MEDRRYNTYNFKHREFLQLHCFGFFGVPSFASIFGRGHDLGDSGLLDKNLPLGMNIKTVKRKIG